MPIEVSHNQHLLLCTGSPADMARDPQLGAIVRDSRAVKVVMGGTTAKIIARELGREINVILRPDPSGLPPTSTVEGIDLISEGVLTLTAVNSYLYTMSAPYDTPHDSGIKFDIVRALLFATDIEIVEGTMINLTHQNPNLPVKLEKRADLVRDLIQLLENKFGKAVTHRRI